MTDCLACLRSTSQALWPSTEGLEGPTAGRPGSRRNLADAYALCGASGDNEAAIPASPRAFSRRRTTAMSHRRGQNHYNVTSPWLRLPPTALGRGAAPDGRGGGGSLARGGGPGAWRGRGGRVGG